MFCARGGCDYEAKEEAVADEGRKEKNRGHEKKRQKRKKNIALFCGRLPLHGFILRWSVQPAGSSG